MPDSPTPLSLVKSLNAKLQVWRAAYYVKAAPLVEDAVYDAAERELKQLVAEHPNLSVLATVLQEVGSDLMPGTISAPIKHSAPMLSLDNAYDLATLLAWAARHPEGTSYVMEPKVDGLSLSVRYVNWTLWLGCTRGTGDAGEDVTPAAMCIADIPHTLDHVMFPADLEVRGEVFMTRQTFARLNTERVATGQEPFKTCRNAASGTLKSHDLKEITRRQLSFQPWQVLGLNSWLPPVALASGKWQERADGSQHFTPDGDDLEPQVDLHPQFLEHEQALIWWSQWTRTRQFQGSRVYRKEDLAEAVEFGRKLRDGIWADVIGDTDGLVFKVREEPIRQQLGVGTKAVRWATAYKFPSMEAVTTLNAVTWQVGRTGAITPVAELEPVLCGGTTNARGNLVNVTYMTGRGVALGDKVTITRGGEVIPKILGVAEESPTRVPITIPAACPSCTGPLVDEVSAPSKENPDGVRTLTCVNLFCPGRLIAHLSYLGSRACLDITGLGDVLAEQFVTLGVVGHLADLWDWANESKSFIDQAGEDAFRAACSEAGFPASQCVDLVLGCLKAKTATWDLWLMALGIPSIAKELGKALAAFLGLGPDDLLTLADRLLELAPKQVDGLGGERIKEIAQWAQDPRAVAQLQQLHQAGVRPMSTVAVAAGPQPLAGEVILVTGDLGPERESLRKQLESLGAKTKTGVSKVLTLVIAGDGAGPSKLTKAAALGIRVEGREWLAKVFEGVGLTLGSHGMDDIPDAFDGL